MLQLREYIDDTEDYINIQVTNSLIKVNGVGFMYGCLSTFMFLFAAWQSSKSADSGRLLYILYMLLPIARYQCREKKLYWQLCIFFPGSFWVNEFFREFLLRWIFDLFLLWLQLELFLSSATVCLSIYSLVAGIFGMNIPYTWNTGHGYMFKWVCMVINFDYIIDNFNCWF